MNSSPTIESSRVTFNETMEMADPSITNATAINQPRINNSTVYTGNLRTGQLELTNSEMVIKGSFNSSWNNTISNSDLTVKGHLLLGQATIGSGSTVIVFGDVDVNQLSFSGTGARVIVFGNSVSFPTAGWNWSISNVDTFAEAVTISNSNKVYFVAEDYSVVGENETDDNGSVGSIEVDLGDIFLHNVEYVGR